MEYLSSNGEMKIVQSLKDLPENMEIPLAILNHLDSLKKDEIIESVIPDSELQLAAEKALDKYRETWSCYQDKKIQFHEIFESVLTKATAEDAHKMQSLETGFKQELTATFAQYSAALKELAETHQAILQTIDKSEIAQILKQQRRELTECHQYWVTQLKDLNSHQKQEFELELNKIFRKINGEPVSECEGEEPSEAPEPQNANLTDQVQSKPAIAEPLSHSSIPQNEKVRSLQEMGFSISDAETALKITNSDLDQALAILLENPQMISEYKDAISRQEKLLGESIGAKLLKKSSSLFSLPESNEKVQRQVPKLDWEARRRGDSASKSHTNSKSEKSNPDSKRNSTEKNPFEKIMGAFGSFFNEEGDIDARSPEMQNLSETFAFFCGTQHVKVKYNCQLKVEDLGSILNPKISEAQELALKAASDHTLYSNNLRGLIIFVRECDIPRYGSDQKINAAVFKRSSSTPELHFDSLSDQITSTLENNSDLKIGDFIITRHSNLYPFHIVFHLVCPNEFEEFDGQSSLAKGYRLILKTCATYHIKSLTIPILLNPRIEPLPNSSQILKRVDAVFKQTKAALTEYASISGEQNETRQLIFLITNTQGSGDEFDVIRNSLTSVFRVI